MVRNRTEELERRLDELEATVRGLTEELVEAHGRISELEDHLEDDAESEAPTKRMTEAEKNRTERAAQADESSDGTDEETDLDDIIVA